MKKKEKISVENRLKAICEVEKNISVFEKHPEFKLFEFIKDEKLENFLFKNRTFK